LSYDNCPAELFPHIHTCSVSPNISSFVFSIKTEEVIPDIEISLISPPFVSDSLNPPFTTSDGSLTLYEGPSSHSLSSEWTPSPHWPSVLSPHIYKWSPVVVLWITTAEACEVIDIILNLSFLSWNKLLTSVGFVILSSPPCMPCWLSWLSPHMYR